MTASPTSSGAPPPKYMVSRKASKLLVSGWIALTYVARRAADCDAPSAMSRRTSSPPIGSTPWSARSGPTTPAAWVKMSKE